MGNVGQVSLFDGVGKNAHVDHVAVQTAFGMMIAAKMLFIQLGYEVHPTRKAEGAWGKAIFMVKKGSIPIQLTDSNSTFPVAVEENHLAIIVDDPATVAMQIYAWAQHGGVEVAQPESVPGGKVFISVTGIITMPIELVPALFKPCPECGGKGEIVRGSEGRGYHYPCPTCKGKKTVPAD